MNLNGKYYHMCIYIYAMQKYLTLLKLHHLPTGNQFTFPSSQKAITELGQHDYCILCIDHNNSMKECPLYVILIHETLANVGALYLF